MNPLSDWLAQPLVPRVGWTLVHFLWQGSAIAALFAIAQIALQKRSAQARYLAGCFALALMVLAPFATFARLNDKAGPPSQVVTAHDTMRAKAPKESGLGNAIAGSAMSMNRLNWS